MASVRVSPADLEPESARLVMVAGEPVCLARAADGTYHAIDDTCSHENFSLSEGEVFGHQVECPQHGSRFDLRTGKPDVPPAVRPVRTHPTRVEDGEVYVESPA